MTIALLFPGQGSQHIGMGKELFDTFREARDVFQEVDDILSYKLSALMFSGEMEELTQTNHAQPAIMAVSIAAFRVMEKQLGNTFIEKIKYVAGHSLGEYSALCSA